VEEKLLLAELCHTISKTLMTLCRSECHRRRMIETAIKRASFLANPCMIPMLQVIWRSWTIAEQWLQTEGTWITKEGNSTKLGQSGPSNFSVWWERSLAS